VVPLASYKLDQIIDNAKIGIQIGKMMINIFLYADDVVLLAELKKMINIVENFGIDLEIKFRSFTKELLKFYNGVPYRDSILHPMLNYISNNPLSRYLTTKNMTEYAKFAYDYITHISNVKL
jgi:hypothetical protein